MVLLLVLLLLFHMLLVHLVQNLARVNLLQLAVFISLAMEIIFHAMLLT